MYSKNVRKSKLKSYKHKKILLSSAIMTITLFPSSLISQQLINPKFNETNKYSKQSFVTKAVEKTGPSVVTIETQRFVKKRKFPRDAQIFLDPYF